MFKQHCHTKLSYIALLSVNPGGPFLDLPQHLWTCMIIALESNWKLQKLSTTFASVIYERRWGEELLWIKPEKSLKRKIIRSRLSSVSPSVQSLCPPCHLTETNGKQNSYIWRWNLPFPAKFTFTAGWEENINLFRQSSYLLNGGIAKLFYSFISPVGHNIWWENSRTGSFGPKSDPKCKFSSF